MREKYSEAGSTLMGMNAVWVNHQVTELGDHRRADRRHRREVQAVRRDEPARPVPKDR